MRGKLFLSAAVVLLFLFSAMAWADSGVVLTTIKNEVSVGGQAKFSLKITNTAEEKQRYTVYSFQSGQGWNVDPSPLSDKIIEIYPGKSYTTTIIAQPLEDFSPGIYYVHITIESDTGERHNKALKIYLSPEKPIDYLPSIRAALDMDEKINPKEPVSVKLFLENRNPLDLADLKIKIQSDMPEFTKEVSVNLPPLEKKTVEFTINPNPYQQPKKYTLFFVFEHLGEVAKVMEKKIEIVSLLPPFIMEVEEEAVYFKIFKQLTIRNDGNVLNTQDVKLPTSFVESLFTSSDGKVKKIDGQRYLVWEVSLSPNESSIINLIVNYRILFYILAILIIFAGFYFYVQSSIAVNKSATTTKSDDEGALSEIKITLEVKNKSKRPIKDVMITDIVPGIANVEKGLELGTLKPKEVKHTKRGTKVIWSLAELDTHEQRLITYKVKAKLNIVGMFSLPRAVVEYARKGRRKRKKAYSNVFRLGG